MNAGRDVERLLSDWPSRGSMPAPRSLRPAAGDRIDHTKQWRFGVAWRSGFMRNNWRVAAAAVVGVLLIVLGAEWMTRPLACRPACGDALVIADSSTESGGANLTRTAIPITAADSTAEFMPPLSGFAVRPPAGP